MTRKTRYPCGAVQISDTYSSNFFFSHHRRTFFFFFHDARVCTIPTGKRAGRAAAANRRANPIRKGRGQAAKGPNEEAEAGARRGRGRLA